MLLFTAFSFTVLAQVRTSMLLDKNWKFTRSDDPQSFRDDFNDSKWQSVTVPHDWAIYGPFDKFNDLQEMAISQDGQTKALPHSGRTGGLPFVGVGWYRTVVNLPSGVKQKSVLLQFDGAMSRAEVYVNGSKVGYWPYGYNSFFFDISAVAREGNNTIAVRLNNPTEFSRWYPGAGIYRNVHLTITEKAKIKNWGHQIISKVVNNSFAKIEVRTAVELPTGVAAEQMQLETEIFSKDGISVAKSKSKLSIFDEGKPAREMIVMQPKLWDTENPYLYKAVSRLYYGNQLTDEYETVFGIRTIELKQNEGFFLNGKKVIFQGVCNHHDLGPLGAAVNEAAIRRQVRILKDMGVNAIRTSHNMPAPELVKACNEMGMMLMLESFDEWKEPKMKNGYNQFFDEWAEKDVVNLVHHYRNDPSVVMWCIGNEVPDQATENGPKLARFLQNICHREDPTRPVTNGKDYLPLVIDNGFAAIHDIPGMNYRSFIYGYANKKLSHGFILGSETASTVSSRGVYKFPVKRQSMAKYPDHQSSSYDVEHCSWSDLPEDNFIQHDDLPFMMGEFVWTGFDYLGEPTPYYTEWPSHSSLFGIVDLAGIPKDRFYLYRSHWNKNQKTLHILPHWNWPEKVGDTVPVFVYTNYPSAELFINGKSQGKITKDTSVKQWNSNSRFDSTMDRQRRYRLMWMNTIYQPGEVKVVAYDQAGNPVADTVVRTAGKPYKIVLSVDRSVIKSDGKDLSFINVRLVDKNGNFCPTDERQIKFTVKGAGNYLAAANGNPSSLESFQLPQMKLFSGQLTAIVQAGNKPGKITFEASAKGVKNAAIEISAE